MHINYQVPQVIDLQIPGKFAVVIDNLFSEEFCKKLIDFSEQKGDYTQALVGQVQHLNVGYRNSQRWLYFNKDLADEIYSKIDKYFPHEFGSKHSVCLNERLSFLKYTAGNYFKPHYDGYYTRPNGLESSKITVQIYLNTVPEHFGGETTIFLSNNNNAKKIKVNPVVGRVLLFQHNIRHEGSLLKDAVKYAIRSDIMYTT